MSENNPETFDPFARQRRFITVMFVDIVQSSQIIATRKAEEAQNIFELILSRQIEICTAHGGIVNQTMGDGMMCLFGVDAPTEDHAFQALSAAEAMIANIIHLQEQYPDDTLALRVGICTGDVILKPAGSTTYGAYMVTGDTVHIADRILKAAAPNTILVSERTAKLLGKYFTFREASTFPWTAASSINLYEKISCETTFTKADGQAVRADMLTHVLSLLHTKDFTPIWLQGDAGLGKTFLANQILNALQAETARKVIRLSFYPQPLTHQASVEHRILREILAAETTSIESIADDTALYDLGNAALVRACLSDILGMNVFFSPAYASLDAGSRTRMQRTVTSAALRRASIALNVIVMIEDMHWASDDEAQTIDAILAPLCGHANPVVIFTSRHKSPFDAEMTERLHVVELAPFSGAQAKSLLECLCGKDRLPHHLATRLCILSQGNAFFMKEYCDWLHASLRSGTSPDDALQLIDSEIPGEVANVLHAKLARLPAQMQALAKTASIQGLRFDARMLAGMAALPATYVIDNLMQMQADGILRHCVTGDGHSHWEFSHEIMHRAIYTSITLGQRVPLHAEALRYIHMAGARNRSYPLLAYHARHAGMHKLDYIYSKWAALNAMKHSQHGTALRYLAMARKALGKLEGAFDLRKHEVVLDFHEIGSLFIISRYTAAQTRIEHVLAAKAYLPGTRLLKETLSYQGLLHWVNGEIPKAAKIYAAILKTSQPEEDSALFLRESARLSHAYIDLGQYQKSIRHAQEAYSLLSGKDPYAKYGLLTEMGPTLLSCLALASAELGDYEASGRYHLQTLALMAESKDYFTHVYVSTLLAHALIAQDCFKEAHDLLCTALHYCNVVQSALLKPYILAALGITLSQLGKTSEGLNYGESALAIARKSNLQSRRPLFHVWYAESLMIDRQYNAAMRILRKAIKGAVASGEEGRLAYAYLLMAECYKQQDMQSKDYALFYKKAQVFAKSQRAASLQRKLNNADVAA